jgi:sugar (pentulose or hexulose) kinase
VVSEPLLLGLDAGTTAVKAAVIDARGEEVAHGRAPTPWRRVPSGAEIDPVDLLRAALSAGHEALSAAPGGRVAGIGVASMAETGVLTDGRGRPVVPAIAWHDSRGAEQAERLAAELGRERFAERTGLPVRPMFSLVKYRWLRDTLPEAARGERWLSVGEWIVRRLGGDERVSELSLASRTGWLDLHSRAWWDEALAWAGASRGLLGEPVPAATPAGRASAVLERARGAVLAVGGHDHMSAAVGAGATGDGDVLISWGTANAFVRATAPLAPEQVRAAVADGLTVGWHAATGRQYVLGANRAGAALQRVLDLLGVGPDGRERLERAALAAEPGGLELRGLEGDRNALTGIADGASPARVWRAALESTGRAAAELLDRMARRAGPQRRVVLAGGWAEGAAAQAVMHAHLGPFELPEAVYMGARGAALTAGRAAGLG